MGELAKMLATAMAAEKTSVRCYEIMLGATMDIEEKELLTAIRREERRHYYLFEGMYEQSAGKPLQIGKAPVSMPKNFCDMLKTAICDKLEAVEFYEELFDVLECPRDKEWLAIILADEKDHARLLATIYDKY